MAIAKPGPTQNERSLEGARVANPKWGTKRSCQSCGTKFYDLHKSPIVCPSCGATFDPEALLKSRRSRAAPKPEPAPKPKAKPVADADADESDDEDGDIDLDDAEADAMLEEAGEDDEEDFIEDTADLGDDDDIGDVVVEEEKDDT